MPLIENLCCRETKLTQVTGLKEKTPENIIPQRQIWKLQTVNALTTVRGVNELHLIRWPGLGQERVRRGDALEDISYEWLSLLKACVRAG